MKNAALIAMGMLCLYTSTAEAARWVGPATSSGDVLQPETYKEAVADLYFEKNDFENLTPGTNVALQSFGMFTLVNSPFASTSLLAESGNVAGALPSSGTMALRVTRAPSQPTALTLQTSEPVRSIGFVLMGLESASWMTVYGGLDGGQVLGRYFITDVPQTGMRRWVAVAEDSRIIQKIKLEPTQAEDYAIDDVQIAVHAPEPSMLMAWIFILPSACSRRRRYQW
jgi:hypothetical protein